MRLIRPIIFFYFWRFLEKRQNYFTNIYYMSFTIQNDNDNYMTMKQTWENINDYIPKNKIVYEPFYGDGNSGEYLRELNCLKVIHEDIDFFNNNFDYDIIISNIPFSLKRKIFERLRVINKPFIILGPSSLINAVWFRKLFKEHLQIIIPEKLHFKHIHNKKFNFNWGVYYYCYKMDFDKDLIFI